MSHGDIPQPPYPLFPGYKGTPFLSVLVRVGVEAYPAPFAAPTTPFELRAYLRRDRDIASKIPGADGVDWQKLPEVWSPEDGALLVRMAGAVVIPGTARWRIMAISQITYFEDDSWKYAPGVLEDWGSWEAYTRPLRPLVVN